MPDKYKLDREMSIFVAKKYLKESVYRSAHLEGMAVTFPQTEAIIENLAVEGVAPKDISKVCDLRDAWDYILGNLEEEIDLKFLMELHMIVAREDVAWNELGKLRSINVRITGTNYLPEIPNAERIHKKLTGLLENPHVTDRAIELGLYIMRTQPFLDGNKRIGTLAANHILIKNGRGIFSVPDNKVVQFSELLVQFYETGEMDEIKKFIYENCLTGVEGQ